MIINTATLSPQTLAKLYEIYAGHLNHHVASNNAVGKAIETIAAEADPVLRDKIVDVLNTWAERNNAIEDAVYEQVEALVRGVAAQ